MDSRYLRQALDEADARLGLTCPNPAVGAVLVRGEEVVGVGSHWGAGSAHAEVGAVERAGERARGATLYVTLEPCCHHGRTPPCTDLIKQSGIERVVYGLRDPNPLVAGKGAEALNQAGIPCALLALPDVEAFYESYRHWTTTGLPWVTAKLAVSQDGRIAGPNGAPIQLTGEEAFQLTHDARRRTAAILTTVKTVQADDPSLNARGEGGVLAKPVFVLDRRAEFPLTAKLWKTSERLVLFHGADAPLDSVAALKDQGAEAVELPSGELGLSLESALRFIGEAGYHSLWVEAGGKLFQRLLQEKRVNRARVYVAPVTVGEGVPAFVPESFLSTAASVRWSKAGADKVGDFEFVS